MQAEAPSMQTEELVQHKHNLDIAYCVLNQNLLLNHIIRILLLRYKPLTIITKHAVWNYKAQHSLLRFVVDLLDKKSCKIDDIRAGFWKITIFCRVQLTLTLLLEGLHFRFVIWIWCIVVKHLGNKSTTCQAKWSLGYNLDNLSYWFYNCEATQYQMLAIGCCAIVHRYHTATI